MKFTTILSRKHSRNALTRMKTHVLTRILNRMILLFVLVGLPLLLLMIAHRQEIIMVPEIILVFLEAIVIILVSFAIGTIFIRFTLNTIQAHFDSLGEPEEKILLSKVYIGLIYSLALVIIFWQLGIDPRNIAIFLGLITTGFAFAIRDIILSYFIWFILLTKKPFKIGDYINVGDNEGLVKHIGLFYVVVDPTPSNYEDYYKIPNKTFLENPIRNYGCNRIPKTFDFYLKEIPANFEERVENIRKKAMEISYTDAKFYIYSDKDGVRLSAFYKTRFENINHSNHQLLGLILEEFGVMQNNG